MEAKRYLLNKPITIEVDGETEKGLALVVCRTATAGLHLFMEAESLPKPSTSFCAEFELSLKRRLSIKPDFDTSGFPIRTHCSITRQYFSELLSRGILVPTGEFTAIGDIEFPIAHFVWAKCSDNFKCSRCEKLVSSSQVYFDESDLGCFCLACEAILGGDVEPEFDFDTELKEIDELDF